MPKANLSNGMKCSVVWEFVFISCMELWCVARLLVCPLRPRCFDTSLTEWNPFLLALTGFKTLPVHLHKSQFLKNLKAHSFLIVQLISLTFWLILNSLNCLCKDERLGFFFSPKASDTVAIIVNMITCHLVPWGLSLLICKMKECYPMSLPIIMGFCAFHLLLSCFKLCL